MGPEWRSEARHRDEGSSGSADELAAVKAVLLRAIGVAAEEFDEGAVSFEFLEGGGDWFVVAVAGEVDVEDILPVLLFGGPGFDL